MDTKRLEHEVFDETYEIMILFVMTSMPLNSLILPQLRL